MKRKMNVLDIRIDQLYAKEALQRAVSYMQTEPISIVKIVTTDILMQAGEIPELKEYIEYSDLVIAGEKQILEAAEIEDKKMLSEAENRIFVKLFLQYLHKHQSKVFVLGGSQEEILHLEQEFSQHYHGIQIVGTECVTEDTADDLVLNQVNGAETECIIAILPTPLQEAFAARNRQLFHANLWLGLGKNMKFIQKDSKYKFIIQTFFSNHLFKREIEKEKRKKEQ